MAPPPHPVRSWLLVATETARGVADRIRSELEDGLSIGEIAWQAGVQKSVVEWWLAIGRLPPPHAVDELVALADRGMLAAELAEHYGHSANAIRKMLHHARETRAPKHYPPLGGIG